MFNPARLACALVLGVFVAVGQAAPLYRITLLPPVGSSYCQGNAMNDEGMVTGYCGLAGFVWTAAAGMQLFSDPAFPESALNPRSINSAGVVLGERYDINGSLGRNPPFVWDPVVGFVYFGTSERHWTPRSINSSGQAVGWSWRKDDVRQQTKAFHWSYAGGVEHLSPVTKHMRTQAFDNNDLGQVAFSFGNVDEGTMHCLRLEPDGKRTPLPRMPNCAPIAINPRGHVAGFMWLPDGRIQAFLWTPEGGIQELDTRTGLLDQSFASDVNDAGQVVGLASAVDPRDQGSEWAFYWDAESGMVDLLTLLDPADPLRGNIETLQGAGVKINAHGQIMVNAWQPSGYLVPVVLTPLP